VSLSEGGIKVEVSRNDESLGLEDDLMASELEDWDKLGVEVRGRRASP